MRALMYAYVHVQFSHVLSVCMYVCNVCIYKDLKFLSSVMCMYRGGM